MLQNEYINKLKEDTSFNSVMTDLISKTVEKTKMKDTVSMDKLLDIAVKFFGIIEFGDNGKYTGKFCIGDNFIKKTEKVRKPQIEAFCYSAISSNYQEGPYNLQKEFAINRKELRSINLGIDNDERLLRAQGAMFFLMKNNENLKKMLISEYEKNKENLPFILKE